jgi:hypothetical protein
MMAKGIFSLYRKIVLSQSDAITAPCIFIISSAAAILFTGFLLLLDAKVAKIPETTKKKGRKRLWTSQAALA